MKDQWADLLVEIVARRKPELIEVASAIHTTTELDGEVLGQMQDVVVHELLDAGLDSEGEHTAYGRKIEDVIGGLARLQQQLADDDERPRAPSPMLDLDAPAAEIEKRSPSRTDAEFVAGSPTSGSWQPRMNEPASGTIVIASLPATFETRMELRPGSHRRAVLEKVVAYLRSRLDSLPPMELQSEASYAFVGLGEFDRIVAFGYGTWPAAPEEWIDVTVESLLSALIEDLLLEIDKGGRYLGSVRNISAGRKSLDLHVFDNGIVIGKGDLRGMTLRVAGVVGFGEQGYGIADDIAKHFEQLATVSRSKSTLDEFLASDPANHMIALDSIKAVRLSHPRFPPVYRIDLEMTDGRTERFQWKRLHNEPKDVVALFQAAAGDRLTTSGH